MTIYSKLLAKIRNNKTKVKKSIGIVTMAVGLRYGSINPISTNLSSNSTQQVEQVHNYVEEDVQVVNTDGKVKDGLSRKSSSSLIKTGSGILIGNRQMSEGSKSDLRNPQCIKELISGIRGGDDTLDEELIRSIISKVSESDWDIPSINKILKKLAEGTLEIGTNDKLMRIVAELQKPIAESPLAVTSSSIFVEGLLPELPRHRKRNEVEWKKENKSSTPSADYLLDSTKCYGHREAYNMPRSVSEQFETNAVKNLAKKSLKNPRLKKEYRIVKDQLKKGVHPVNLSEKSTYVSSTKVLVKKSEGRYIVDVSDTNADIVAVSCRTDQKCMEKFKTLMNKLYNLDLKGY